MNDKPSTPGTTIEFHRAVGTLLRQAFECGERLRETHPRRVEHLTKTLDQVQDLLNKEVARVGG